MVNYGRTSSALSNHQIYDFVPLTHMHEVGDATGIFHVQEGTVDQQALSSQLNGINDLSSVSINEVRMFLLDMYLVYAYEILK